VKTSRSAGQENSRISIEPSLNVILDCVLAKWEDFAPSLVEGTNWLEQIAVLMSEGITLHCSLLNVSWLGHLHHASLRSRALFSALIIIANLCFSSAKSRH
jgi:hypothetical protein